VLLDISEFAIYNLLQELEKAHQSLKIIPVIGSIQDPHVAGKVLKTFLIDTIYHAAAYKHVPLMEQNVAQCISNNVFGTKTIAEDAVLAKVKDFILVSTDKAVNPTNFMGASKRLAELVCQNLSSKQSTTRFAIVRFGNVLGSSGSVVPLFKQQIASGGPVTVTHNDVIRYFMTIPEAAQLVIQAGSLAKGGDIFVLDMGKPMKIIDLAKKMIILSGKKPLLQTKSQVEPNEILIQVTGLRPGEKLFEELTYSENITGTIHPRIMTTDDIPISNEELTRILDLASNAITNDNHETLCDAILQICRGVADADTSNDVFFKANEKNTTAAVVSLPKK
jgi:FlaA1/EpsC-like NDP-sugar epimerase